jgi:hypothetical protein
MASKKKKAAWGSMIHAKKSKYIQSKFKGVLPPIMHSEVIAAAKKRKHATGAMIHAKTSAFAANPEKWRQTRATATTGMKIPSITKGTKGTGRIAKLIKGFKTSLGITPGGAVASGAINPSKWLSKIPKGSQLSKLSKLKDVMKVGGKRSLAFAGGPIGLGMYAGTKLAKAAVTSAFKGYKKDGKWTKEGTKRLESQARAREALMAKRNKARNAQTGAMIRATHGVEVLGKQSVPFESQGATANLAAERQGRKGAAVRGFNFKGVF